MSSSTFFTLLLTIAIVNGAPTSTQVSSSSVTSVAASSLNCTQLQMESDTCIKRTMLLFDRNVKFPRTTDDLDFYCNHVDTNLKCVRKYSQCLKSFPKQVFAIIMSNLKSLVKDMCSNDKVKQDVLYHAKCLNEETMPEIHNVIDIMSTHLNYIANNVTIEDKIPNLCCGFFLGRDIVFNKVASLCDNVTGPSTKEYILRVLSKASSDAIDLGCGAYSSLQVCDTKVPQHMKILRELAQPSTNSTMSKQSFFIPMIKIAEELGS